MPAENPEPVLLFDGECGLCQRVVRTLLRLDRAGHLRYAPLQGAAGQEYLKAHGLPTQDFDTIVFVPDWRHRERGDYQLRTDGVIGSLQATGKRGTRLAGFVRIFPRRFRDSVYRAIGHWRYRIFGPAKPRPLRPEWAERFLP